MSDLPPHTSAAVLAVLLDTYADQQPCPKAPKWERDAERGLTAGAWYECPTCHGEGKTKRRNHWIICPNRNCQGAGGWKVDPYTDGRKVEPDSKGASELSLLDFYETAETIAEHSGERGIDRILFILARSAADRDRPDREPHPCWAELETALTGLSLVAPRHIMVLHAHHITRLPISPLDLEVYDDALDLLASLLPHTFRAPNWARVKAQGNHVTAKQALWRGHTQWAKAKRDERLQMIHKWTAEGHTNEEIQRRTGLSVRRIQQLRNSEREAA